MSKSDAYIDVVELCVLLQCLGFKVKSLDTSDVNISQDGGGGGDGVRSVVVNCQSSGLHVVLETMSATCTCPPNEKQNSGFWEVSGVSGGKQADKECGSALFGAIPKSIREHITTQLNEVLATIKEAQALCPDGNVSAGQGRANKSASMMDMNTPDKMSIAIKIDTPGRYRSLDTLTSKSDPDALPTPGQLQKKVQDLSTEEVKPDIKNTLQMMCARQSTYTISTPDSFRTRNKTSSPIHPPPLPNSMLENLVSAERAAEDLRNKLSAIVKDFMDDGKNDSSMSSLALDVSKISVLKAAEISKTPFASSPNLSGSTREELTKSRLKRFESASTYNLSGPPKEDKVSKLKRLSPNFFTRKDTAGKDEKSSKLNTLFKPKIVKPIRTPSKTESSPSLNNSKKKYSHIKSTIPRPSTRKDTN